MRVSFTKNRNDDQPTFRPRIVGRKVDHPCPRFSNDFGDFGPMHVAAHFPTPPPQPVVSRAGSGNPSIGTMPNLIGRAGTGGQRVEGAVWVGLKGEKQMVLQRRDKRILLLCYQQQFLLTEHVLHLFENGSYREARRRLRELIREGFLYEESNAVLGRKPIIRLTILGAKIAAADCVEPIPQQRILKTVELTHDAIITSVRIRLERVWEEGRFVPERAIKKSQYRQIPDGLFMFPSGKGIAIEVENSDKGRSRVLRLLDRWSDIRHIILILYVATSDSLFESFKKYLASAPKGQPVGLVHWRDLQAGTPMVWTPRGEMPLLERRTF